MRLAMEFPERAATRAMKNNVREITTPALVKLVFIERWIITFSLTRSARNSDHSDCTQSRQEFSPNAVAHIFVNSRY